MSIFNELGQTSYAARQPEAIEGQPGWSLEARTYVNPLLAQIDTIAVGGTASDGEYSITVTEPDGTEHVVAFTRGSGETSAQIAAGLRAAAPASAAGVFSLGGTSTNVVITFEHPDIEYQIALSAPGTGTLTRTETQSPGGSDIPLARMVVDGSGDVDGLPTIALPDGTADEGLFRGVVIRERTSHVNRGASGSVPTDQIGPGRTLPVGFAGEAYVRNVGSTAAARHGQVFVVVDTSGGQELGQMRADDDGANSIPVGATRAYWIDPVPAGEVGRIFLRM